MRHADVDKDELMPDQSDGQDFSCFGVLRFIAKLHASFFDIHQFVRIVFMHGHEKAVVIDNVEKGGIIQRF